MSCGYGPPNEDGEHGQEVYAILVAKHPEETVTSCDLHLTSMLPLGVDVVVRREA